MANPGRAIYHLVPVSKLSWVLSNQSLFTPIVVYQIGQGPFSGFEDKRHGLA